MRNDEVDLFSYFLGKLRAEYEQISMHVTNGGMKNFDDYRFNIGRLHGLTTAIELIKATAKNYDSDN